jgi:nicotinamidase-related amidase
MTILSHRSPELLDRRRSRFVLIDLQERLLGAIPDAERVVETVAFLGAAARLFDVPVEVTEQYPAGLGSTVPALAPLAGRTVEKRRFSGVEALGLTAAMDRPEPRDQVVLVGVETHVCVLQTAYDLLTMGYRVWVLTDGVASRHAEDHAQGLARLRDQGVTLTTAEAAAFEWCETADDPQFKALSGLVKNRRR